MEYKELNLISHKNIFWEKATEINTFLLIILVPLVFYRIYFQRGELDKAIAKLEQAITYQESKATMTLLYRAIGTS